MQVARHKRYSQSREIKGRLLRALILHAACLAFLARSVVGQDLTVARVDRVCGPRCVERLAELNGRKTDLYDILVRTTAEQRRSGMSIGELKKLLAEFGLSFSPVKLPTGSLPLLPKPFIAHLSVGKKNELGHYVVVEGFDQGECRASVYNGIYGLQYVPVRELSSMSSGYMLVPDDLKDVALHPAQRVTQSRSDYLTYMFVGVLLLGGGILLFGFKRRLP